MKPRESRPSPRKLERPGVNGVPDMPPISHIMALCTRRETTLGAQVRLLGPGPESVVGFDRCGAAKEEWQWFKYSTFLGSRR